MMKRSLALTTASFLFLLLVAHLAAVGFDTEDYWPQWRGPLFTGMARTGAPTEFNDTKNVKWKIAIPGRGFSTPIVWGDKIFLTTAVPTGKTGATSGLKTTHPQGGTAAGEEQKFMVLCLDRASGKTIWERTAKTAVPHEGYHRMYGSFASNSPVTDGKFVYAFFGSRGAYCYDLNGKLIWEQDLGVKMQIRNQFGEGGAPALVGNNLILNFDQETDSFIVALDKRNGKELWRTKRDETSSWSTPLVVEHKGRPQVVMSATNKVRSYDPTTGKAIWECIGL